MVSDNFRRQLRQEAETWWHDGLIDANLYEKLAERYQFKALEGEAQNRFVLILMGLGGILVGLGVITYVAANWQGWPKEFRTLLLMGLFVTVNMTGFYLWRRAPSARGQRLGHGLLLLGALILGANLGLMSQMFHQSGNLYELYLVWSLAVLIMAYGLRLVSLGVMALILMAIGYGLGVIALQSGSFSGWRLVVEHMPLVLGGLWLPLAYRCRSRVVFGLAAVGVMVTLTTHLSMLTVNMQSVILLALAQVLPVALLWGYSDRIWPWLRSVGTTRGAVGSRQTPGAEPFRRISRGIAGVQLSLMLYGFSFHWLWQNQLLYGNDSSDRNVLPMLVSVVMLAGVALVGWLLLAKQGWHYGRWPHQAINSVTVGGALGLTAIVIGVHETGTALPWLAPLVFNVLLFLLALGLIRDSLAAGNRGQFWGGMVLLVLGIMTRMVEYNTDLLLKALAFALCGFGVILAGIWFERHLKPAQSSHEA